MVGDQTAVIPRALRMICALAVLSALLGGCGGEPWVEFQPGGGGFTVSLPAEPAAKKVDQALALGHLTMMQYMITTNEITFAVHLVDYPPAMTEAKSADDMLDPGLTQMFSKYPQARKESAKATLRGYPGRTFSIIDPVTGYTASGRSCLVGKRVYLLQVIHPTRLDARAQADRFLGSFRVKL